MRTLFVVRCSCQCHSTINHPLLQPGPNGILLGDPHCGRPIYGRLQIAVLCVMIVGSRDIFIVIARISQLDTISVSQILHATSLTKVVPPFMTTLSAGNKASLTCEHAHHHQPVLLPQAAEVLLMHQRSVSQPTTG